VQSSGSSLAFHRKFGGILPDYTASHRNNSSLNWTIVFRTFFASNDVCYRLLNTEYYVWDIWFYRFEFLGQFSDSLYVAFCSSSSSAFRNRPSGLFPSRICMELWTVGSTPWTGDQPCRKSSNYTQDNTHTHTQNKHTQTSHALSGIRTHDPSVWEGEDMSSLWPRGHCLVHSVRHS
jgi:hypothetical protein